MPTYEYACPKCGILEIFQSMREDALKKCPQCHSKKIERLISGGAGLIFKGDGFWETDYNRSDDYKKKAKEDASGQSSDTKSEAKPADKSAEAPKTNDSKPNAKPKAEPKPQAKPQTKTVRKKED